MKIYQEMGYNKYLMVGVDFGGEWGWSCGGLHWLRGAHSCCWGVGGGGGGR